MRSSNVKRFFGYLFYTFLIIIILIRCSEYELQLKHLVSETYKPFPYVIFKAVYPIVLGFFMGLPKIIKIFYTKSAWSFDWPKFIAVGIPALFITLTPVVYILPSLNHSGLSKLPSMLLYTSGLSLIPQTISGIVFGYLICSVLNKR